MQFAQGDPAILQCDAIFSLEPHTRARMRACAHCDAFFCNSDYAHRPRRPALGGLARLMPPYRVGLSRQALQPQI